MVIVRKSSKKYKIPLIIAIVLNVFFLYNTIAINDYDTESAKIDYKVLNDLIINNETSVTVLTITDTS